MKTIIQKAGLAAGMLILAAAIAVADEVDEDLAEIASPAVLQSTRGLIQSGLASEHAMISRFSRPQSSAVKNHG